MRGAGICAGYVCTDEGWRDVEVPLIIIIRPTLIVELPLIRPTLIVELPPIIIRLKFILIGLHALGNRSAEPNRFDAEPGYGFLTECYM